MASGMDNRDQIDGDKQNWLEKVTYVDKWGRSAVGTPPEQRSADDANMGSKPSKTRSEKIVRIISYIQLATIVIAILVPIIEFSVDNLLVSNTAGSYFPVFSMIVIPLAFFILIVTVPVELIIMVRASILKRKNKN